jgi:hypothetical protein
MGWQPIETVPKDRLVLVLLDDGESKTPCLARWLDHEGVFVWLVSDPSGTTRWAGEYGVAWAAVEIPKIPRAAKRKRPGPDQGA